MNVQTSPKVMSLATKMIGAISISMMLCGSALGQSNASNDFTATITTMPSIILQATLAGRSQILLQVLGTSAVACRPDGTPSFTGGSLVLAGGSGTPPIGGSAILTGPLADPGVWQCVAYAGTATLVVKSYN